MNISWWAPVALVAVALTTPSCLVESRCASDGDCPSPRICGEDGRCTYECSRDDECGPRFACVAHRCEPRGDTPITCPDDMVSVANAFCVDRYEASRPDATADSPGSEDGPATSRPGVLPWKEKGNAAAAAACAAAGKRLCTPVEWQTACEGPDETVYAYGDSYEPQTCNGIDLFGRAGNHLLPTGSLAGCTNGWGVFDINGNVWEHVAGGDGTAVRGGAYNCIDSTKLHRCDYVRRNWVPSALGFRCCYTPPEAPPRDDRDIREPSADTTAAEDGLVASDGVGCLDAGLPSWDVAPPSDADTSDADSPDASAERDAVDGALDARAPAEVTPDADADETGDASDRADTADGADTAAPSGCPEGSVPISETTCMDRYEASRPDATATHGGTDGSRAVSQPGVVPWFPISGAQTAETACAAAGKRLCTAAEWYGACAGPEETTYVYGDTYSADTCNGIDAFCDCAPDGPCGNEPACPFPHCRADCGARYTDVPTGSFPDCVDAHGVYDLNGNVWEIVSDGAGGYHYRGGAYNCGDSEYLHQCSREMAGGVSAKGFRCCADRAGGAR